MDTEPIRWAVLVSALLSATATGLITWSQGVDWRVAVATALTALVLPGAGGEVARRNTYSRATYRRATGLDPSADDEQ